MRKIISEILKRRKDRIEFNIQFEYLKKMRSGGMYIPLSSKEKKEIQTYYLLHYGKKINISWHEYYYYVNKEFTPKYIPTYVYYGDIISKLNDKRIGVVYSDKNMLGKLVGNIVKYPKTYAKNVNGVFYIDDCVVSRDEAINACLNISDGIVKQSIDSSQGKSIIRFKSINGVVEGKDCPKTVTELFDKYGRNFVIQEAIQQHSKMAELNPTSLNTIRIMTYWTKNDGVVVLYSVVRMGRLGAVVDNASAGGLYCGVKIDGFLKEKAYTLTPLTVHEKSDTGVVFKDFQIPMYETLKNKAIELHYQFPYSKFIGWDLCVNSNGEVVLIEINANRPGLFQVATGPAFGDYTEEILSIAKK